MGSVANNLAHVVLLQTRPVPRRQAVRIYYISFSITNNRNRYVLSLRLAENASDFQIHGSHFLHSAWCNPGNYATIGSGTSLTPLFEMQCFASFPTVAAYNRGTIHHESLEKRSAIGGKQWIHGCRYSQAKSRRPQLDRRRTTQRAITASLEVGTVWDQIQGNEFDKLMAEQKMSLCFVGMSNCGKSHWSERLQREMGFSRTCVDDEIERAIKPELESLGYEGISGLAEWMGYPSDERFAEHEARYLELEEHITATTSPSASSNFVLDTTGSVIYLNSKTLSILRDTFLIVHLSASEDMLEEMKVAFFETPKPVVWGDSYSRLASESTIDSLKRCYDGLLQERFKRYSKLAHVAIPASVSRDPETKMSEFLHVIRSQLVR